MLKRFVFPALVLSLAACMQEKPAPIDYKGGYFFGRDGAYDRQGNELPKYSAYNPAPGEVYHEEKFVSQDQRYGVSAEVPDVSANELPPPDAVSPVPLESPALLQPTESVTVTAPAAERIAPLREFESADIAEPAVVTPPPPAAAADTASVTFIWPLRGQVISRFGSSQGGRSNDGINIKAREGEPVRVSADGVVVYADSEIKGFGNMAIVRHSGGYLTAYAHASELVVKKGDDVVKGQLIGFVGKTGNVDSAQLHYSIRKDKTPIDPEELLTRD